MNFGKIGQGVGTFYGGIYGGLFGKQMGNKFGGGGDEDPYGGMPQGYPTYVGMEGPELDLAGQFNGPNAPMDKFAGESLRNGPSSGTQFALQQNTLGANSGRDQARRMASGMGKNAAAGLAMHGGLDSGAAERVGKYSTDVGMEAAQGADANASQNRAGLLLADENARTGNLAQAGNMLEGLNMNRYQMKAGDTARRQAELDRRNAYNMNYYNQQMGAWGAGKQADATAKSGKKS